MTDPQRYRYDVFVSYSQDDHEWVWQWLLPRLEAAGLSVCLDDRCFELGAPRATETERVIKESRRIVAVLSPAWAASQWDAFEVLLVHADDPAASGRRLIPLLLQPCDPPERIKLLQWVDVSDPAQQERQIGRVIAAIQGKAALPELRPETAFPSPKQRRSELRWYAVAGVAAVLTLILVGWLIWNTIPKRASAMPDGFFNIAVAPFEVIDTEGRTYARTSFKVVAYSIAYVAEGDIYLIEPNGANKRRLTGPNQTVEAEPDWSPYGGRIAYQSNAEVFRIVFDGGESVEPLADKTGDYNIWVIGSSGSPELVVDGEVDVREPDWSPDGASLVYRAGGESNEDGTLMLYDFDAQESQPLSLNEIKGRSPVWSPDGKMIAFMSERTGRWQVYIYDLETGRERQLTRCLNHCRFPNWAPDGGSILFHSADSSLTPLVAWRAWLDRSAAQRLLNSDEPGRPVEAGAGWIAYNGPSDIYVFDPISKQRTRVPSTSGGIAPDWSPAISKPLELGTPVP